MLFMTLNLQTYRTEAELLIGEARTGNAYTRNKPVKLFYTKAYFIIRDKEN